MASTVSLLPGPEPVPAGGSLPSGIVTFLFTDIEGSTERWELSPTAMEEAAGRLDGLVRGVITENGGFVFKTIGDAFCAAFNRVSEAIAAALEMQRVVAAEDFSTVEGLSVRAALHSGATDERGGDYFGPPVNRVARLLSIGHGGQVLLSGITRDLAQGLLPPGAALRELGVYRLKDLAEPERVFQLVAPGLAEDFPRLRSLDALANNLPATPTSFFGRETDIAEIATLLERHRLVTLTGSGGVGKTRASLQVAADLIERFPDGAWFVELAPLSDAAYVPTTIAQVMGLTLGSSGDAVQDLVAALGSKNALLLLDNCEHILGGTAGVTAALLRGCPNLRILATSRQLLGIAGEAAYRMPSLSLEAGVALFADRARSANQRFTLNDDNRIPVTDICRRLDGIPLAIELAAARVKILSPHEIDRHLDQRFRVLTGGSRDALPRQQTLRSLIDWSHDLLDERERALFRRLGIFVNGFTLEGAVAVGSGEDLDELEIFDVLVSLVDKSLVLAEAQGESTRYRLLESTRAYASEKLATANEQDSVAGKHLTFFVGYFADARERFTATMQNEILRDALGAELEDIRSALDSALKSPRVLEAAKLVANIAEVWVAWALEREGLRRLQAFIDAVPENEPLLLRHLWLDVARLYAFMLDGPRELRAASKAVDYARSGGQQGGALGTTLGAYSVAAARAGMFKEAEAALDEAQAIPGLAPVNRLGLQIDRALLLDRQGNSEAAAREFERLWRENASLGTSFSWGMAWNFGNAEFTCGRHQRTIEIVEEVLPDIRAHDDRQYLGQTLTLLAAAHTALGNLAEAGAAAREAAQDLAARNSESPFLAVALLQLAHGAALGGEMMRAATVEGFAVADLEKRAIESIEYLAITRRDLQAILSRKLTPDELERCRAEGRALSLESATSLALGEHRVARV